MNEPELLSYSARRRRVRRIDIIVKRLRRRCAAMNKGTSRGAIPAKVLVRLRATVIAKLAKQVEEDERVGRDDWSATKAGSAMLMWTRRFWL